ncbi:MAG TPA: helix-turn-helix domain-containing protein [Pseudobacteroides sp.]|uniref:helix-turn-helix domain-containing protein n=1 Tax=Pseudobacteroides sp. TaxID=1968840 RepID=UPI002F9374F3
MEKKEFLAGCIIIGASIIICSFILKDSNLLRSFIPTSAGQSVSVPSDFSIRQNDIIGIYDAAAYLGMDDSSLVSAINSNKLRGLPYTKINNNYIFSRKLIEQWVQEAAKSNKSYLE